MRNRKVIFLVEYDKAGDFFFRLASSLKCHCVFVTALPSVFYKAKKLGYQAVLTGFRNRGPEKWVPDAALNATKAVALKSLSISKGRNRVSEIFNVLKRTVLSGGTDSEIYILTWNGSSISGIAAREIKASFPDVKLLFLEIANLPGKIFVDPEGANAQSSLYRDPTLLDSYPLPAEREFEEWSKHYISEKSRKNYVAPQAKKQSLSYLAMFDFLYSVVLGNNYFGNPLVKLKNYLGIKGKKSVELEVLTDNSVKDFAFLPLQVSNDSQLLINSDIGNCEAVRLVSRKESKLLIKPHPAERDVSYLADVVSGLKNVYVTRENTFDLINSATKVYTINSTVGLEALILGKSVEFLGRSYFSYFDKDRLKKYLFSYLLNFDFFSDQAISSAGAEEILSRAS